jgi:hypothetical protein
MATRATRVSRTKRASRATRATRATRRKNIKSRKYYKKSQYKGRGGNHNYDNHHYSTPSYVGAIQGKFINSHGQQLFTNPTFGIA